MTAAGSVTEDVLAFDDLVDGTSTRVVVGGIPVALVRIGDDVYAIGDTCSHGQVSLSGGEVWCDELEIECPKHGSTFNLRSGEPTTLPATQPVPVFTAAVVAGRVAVTVTVESPEESS